MWNGELLTLLMATMVFAALIKRLPVLRQVRADVSRPSRNISSLHRN